MRVLFLDFDGVLNCTRYFHWKHEYSNLPDVPIPDHGESLHPDHKYYLDPTLISNLHFILQACHVVGNPIMIVYTTSWKHWGNKSLLASMLEPIVPRAYSYGVVRRAKFSSERGHDIGFWLDDHPEVTDYVVVDDNDDCISGLHGEHFFRTDPRDGLTFVKSLEIANYFGIANQMPCYPF